MICEMTQWFVLSMVMVCEMTQLEERKKIFEKKII